MAASPLLSPDSGETAGRRRILDEAAQLFLQRGYASTSLRVIAAAAGMKAGSLYYHFASKEALFLAILQQGIEVMVEAFREAEAQTRGREGRARLATHVRAHLAAMFEHGPYTASHVTTFPTAPDSVRQAMVPARDAYEAMWTGLLEELQERGEIAADTPVGLARLVLFGAMNSSLDWYDPARGDLETLAQWITRQLWSGLSGGAAAARSAS